MSTPAPLARRLQATARPLGTDRWRATAGGTIAGDANVAGEPTGGVAAGDGPADTVTGALDGDLLNVDVNIDADADIAAPVNGAVAANANVAAPIDAAVAANVGSVDSDAVAVSQQDAIINQNIEGSAEATSDQQSGIRQ